MEIGAGEAAAAAAETKWQGATLRELLHYEFSAVGVAADAGGVFVAEARGVRGLRRRLASRRLHPARERSRTSTT